MAAVSSLVSPNLYQNPNPCIRILNPSSRHAIVVASPLNSRPFVSPLSLSTSTPRHRLPRRSISISAVATEEASPTEEGEAARRLYVGNIPRTVTNEELAKIFGEQGSVEKAEVMYDKYSGRSRRFAFVTMSTVEDANVATEKLNETEIGGRKIKVNVTEKPLATLDTPLPQSEESTFVDSPYKVYVGNLAKTVTSDVLSKFFSEKGKVLSAKVSRVPGTSKSSGFGFVTFSSDEDVDAAILSFNNAVLEGQKIRVNKA
ncbi:small ribosomal subunit protein cS22 [Typha angustifolia]|uniref:small ribosomal subunit protein cS22 n=1 Tax=Typha angustifolia TaxID=59011 RepID=UPI003C2F178A